MRARLFSLLVPVLAVLAVGCSDGGEANADLAEAQPDLRPSPPDMLLPDRDPTDHPPALQLNHFGGPTVAAMEPYTIVWHGEDALGQKVHTFMSWLVQSDYWAMLSAEYGGMKGTAKDLVILDDAPPATLDDSQMDGIINTLVTSGKIPEITDNTVLFFVLSQSTKSTMFGAQGCWEYGGYHAETQMVIGGRHIPYAVDLQCAGSALGTSQGFESLTTTLSHEALEAQSDPHPFFAPGWITEESALGGEVADLCVYDNVKQTVPGQDGQPDTVYTVTKSYSNVAAKAGDKEPCQPSDSSAPYFNVAVNPPTIEVDTDASGVGDVDAEYQPFAYGDVGTINWAIVQPPAQGIKVSPGSGQAHAGATIRLHVHVTGSVRSGSYPLVLGVRNAKGGKTHYGATITVN